MFPLHFTRALWAAAITCCMCAMLPLFVDFIEIHIRGYGYVDTEYLGWVLMRLPKLLCSYAVLLLLLSVVIALFWNHAPSRRMLSVPWVASICGAFSGLLLSPALYMAMRILHGDFIHVSVSGYSGTFLDHAPFAAITGALYFFLHSFFIRQALGKKAWLETRA